MVVKETVMSVSPPFFTCQTKRQSLKKGQSNPELWLNAAKNSHKLNSKTKKS
jgi:hypothetical protein